MEDLRTIAHFDLDSFFVSVEIIKDPSLKGKPVIVGGQERGVVAACSYEARKFGIHSAMPSREAKMRCPHAIFIRGDHKEYGRYSRMVTEIIKEAAPVFEKASIDEFYLDLSGMEKYFDPLKYTMQLRQTIMDHTQLPISFGLASNKLLAKMATNQAKPNGFLHIPPGAALSFLAPLSVDEIPGVGKQTFAALQYMGIRFISQLQQLPREQLIEKFGKTGGHLWEKAHGIHHTPVSPYHEQKSVSAENTFAENLTDKTEINKALVLLTGKAASALRREGKRCGCVAIKLRYPDFETVSRQTAIPDTAADDELIPVVKSLFEGLHNNERPIRLLGVRLMQLSADAVQGDLFKDAVRKNQLYKAVDEIREKFGDLKMKRASGI